MRDEKKSVSSEDIRLARSACLYRFVASNHMDMFRRSGHCLYMEAHKGVYIKDGFPGFNDFSTGRHGNPIDFLTEYLRYDFVDAVSALRLSGAGPAAAPSPTRKDFRKKGCIDLPQPADKPYRRMYAYLRSRGISAQMIRHLEAGCLAYQEKDRGNIVFVTPEKDYCELRGTFTYAERPFHGCRKSSPDRFWYLTTSAGKAEKAYICEAAIDAISLLLIHKRSGGQEAAAYISIGGVCNQKAIDRIKSRITTILAVDNDEAGELCRKRNPDLKSIIPVHKDWNEDLLNQE